MKNKKALTLTSVLVSSLIAIGIFVLLYQFILSNYSLTFIIDSLIFIIVFLSLFLYSTKLAVISFIVSIITSILAGESAYKLITLGITTLLGASVSYLIKKHPYFIIAFYT